MFVPGASDALLRRAEARREAPRALQEMTPSVYMYID